MPKRRPHRTEPVAARHAPEPVVAEDVRVFRAAVADVKPLPNALGARVATAPKLRARRPAAVSPARDLDAVMPLIAAADDGLPASQAVAGEATLSFQRAGVRAREMRKLRRGLFPAEHELDLHGLTQSAARGHLADFLAVSRGAGHRCVRVIHGKGYRSGGRGAVLKTAVDSWLRRHSDVLAFVSARAIDGGTGALYVLLRA